MATSMPYQLLADAVLSLHVVLVVFVGGGLVLIVVGNLCGWQGVNGIRFRLLHLAAIAMVTAEAWLGLTCPLTAVEAWLRAKATATPSDTSFIEYWLQRLLYYQAPSWVFTLGYSLFGLVVVLAWWRWPPKSSRRHRHPKA